jgi:3alpha(or 20beta)-hydroxysteroid dehydrogenase
MARVSGKVALISGGARGMGASHARLLVEEGAKVVIGDILDEEGTALAAELGEDSARYVHLDVTDYAEWEAAVAVATEAFGRLDVVVNNAGIANFGPIEEYTIEAWQKIIDINLTGVFYGIKAAIPALKESGKGSIINISSTAGLQGYEALPGYNAAKFGVRGLTKNAALDLGRYNIRVNSVHPGVLPPMRTSRVSADPEWRAKMLRAVPMKREGRVEEVANAVLFLASDEASYITGTELVVDGGYLAM